MQSYVVFVLHQVFAFIKEFLYKRQIWYETSADYSLLLPKIGSNDLQF